MGISLRKKQGIPRPQGRGPLWVVWMDAVRPWKTSTSTASRACSLEGLGCLGMCRQRRRTWGKNGPGVSGPLAGNGTPSHPLSSAAGEKKPLERGLG
ncbi:hypothetical protein, partial [Escherichia coli]|uniref:hypothetical protein n=1 Tax=Escherichia coli TaxID=562 RepID=UPI001BFC0474